MDLTNLSEANPDGYHRSAPLVIASYVIRGFAISGPGKILALLFKSGGGAVLALYVISSLQTFGVHWSFRLVVLCVSVLIVQIVTSLIKYFTLQFRYDENKLSTKKGFSTQKIVDFEWFNVRSIQLTRSTFQRRYSLASISLVTAGSEENAIEIPYIPYSLAIEWEKRVKDQQLDPVVRAPEDAHIDSSAAGKAVPVEGERGEVLHNLTLRDLVQASFAAGNILVDAFLGFFVLGVGYCLYRFVYQILMLPPNISELSDSGPFELLHDQVEATIHNLSANFGADANSLIDTFQQITGLAITQDSQGKLFFFISLALILGILFYLILRGLYIVKFYAFELTQRGIHLQAEDGLMKKRRLTIRRDRVQSNSFRTNFVERSINRGNVKLDSASKFDCYIPFVSTECADRILSTVTEEERTPVTVSPFRQKFTPIHVLSLIQKLVIQVVFLLPIACVLIATFFPSTRGLIWPYSLLLLGIAIVKIYVGWKQKGYIVNDDFLLQREGGFTWWSVTIAPLNKVQSMSIKQNWLQRMRARATIDFNFASGSQSIPFLNLSVAKLMLRTVEDRIRGDSDSPDDTTEDETTKDWMVLPQKYVVSQVIGKLLTSVLVLVPLFLLIAWGIHAWLSVSFELLGWIIAPVWGGIVMWRVVVVCLKIPKYRYICGEHDVIVKESFLAAQTETVRYSRLQSISTRNSLIDGFFGLCDLILYTAEDEVRVKGLDQREAMKLREYIARRLIETSSTGTDALTMTEQPTDSVNAQTSETTRDATAKPEDSIEETETVQWRKFSGWKQEIVMRSAVIVLLIPWILFMLTGVGYAIKQSWDQESGIQLISSVFSWQTFLVTWCILSLWCGSGPFIAIPRKGYLVTADALRYKAGWLYRSHHFIPRSRIQNVSTSATIFDRIFEDRSVKIATGSEDEITLQHLSKIDAEELREELLPE